MARFPVLLTIVFSLLLGCSIPPREELKSARTEVARAYAAGAHRLAPKEYRAASEALHQGERLVLGKKYDQARDVLPLAGEHARLALARSLEVRAKQNQPGAPTPSETSPPEDKKPSGSARPPQKETTPAPPPAEISDHAPAPEKPRPQPKEAPPPPAVEKERAKTPPPSSPSPPAKHAVEEGETLWSIAARKDIYSDALLWPLLYKANRDQIKDPQQIYPGQTLVVPREFSEEEKKEAREKARASDIFPIDQIMKNNESRKD